MAGRDKDYSGSVPPPVNHTSEQRRELQKQVASDVEAFLKAGGKVQTVEDGKRADNPKKPQSQYGSRPL